jgi:hypothetical protein
METLEGRARSSAHVNVALPNATSDLAAQALIEEALRRQRRRWRWIAGSVVAALVAGTLSVAIVHWGSSPPPPNQEMTSQHSAALKFISEAKRGVSGTFTAVYRLSGPGERGTVRVAQLKAPQPFNSGSGTWAFVYQTPSGISSQWIEKDSTAWDCWSRGDAPPWTCSGPGRFRLSNGFIESVLPYVPSDVLIEVSQLQGALTSEPSHLKQLSLFSSRNSQFGKLSCLKVDATGLGSPVTACLDHNGVLVRAWGELDTPWSSMTLQHYSSRVSQTAFRLEGPSTSSGTNFAGTPS